MGAVLMTSTTRKLPVSISHGEYNTNVNEFLVPSAESGYTMFYGIKSLKQFPFGAVSYLGTDVSTNEVFAKLVDSGYVFNSVHSTLSMIDTYIRMLQSFRIGNVIAIEASPTDGGFRLKLVAKSPSTIQNEFK